MEFVQQDGNWTRLPDQDLLETLQSRLSESGAQDELSKQLGTLFSDNQLSSIEKRIAAVWLLDRDDALTTRSEGALWLRGVKIKEKTVSLLGEMLASSDLHKLLYNEKLAAIQKQYCKQEWLLNLQSKRRKLDAYANKYQKCDIIDVTQADLNSLVPQQELIARAREFRKGVLPYRLNSMASLLESERLDYNKAWLLLSLPAEQFVKNNDVGSKIINGDIEGLKALSHYMYISRLARIRKYLTWRSAGILVLLSALWTFLLNISDSSISRSSIFPGWLMFWLMVMPLGCLILRLTSEVIFRRSFSVWQQRVASARLEVSTSFVRDAAVIESRLTGMRRALAQRLQCGENRLDRPRRVRREIKRIEHCAKGSGNRAGTNRPLLLQAGYIASVNSLFIAPALFSMTVFVPSTYYLPLSEIMLKQQHGFTLFWHTRVRPLSTASRYLASKSRIEEIIRDYGNFLEHYAASEIAEILQVANQQNSLKATKGKMLSQEETVQKLESLLANHGDLLKVVEDVENTYSELQNLDAERYAPARFSRVGTAIVRARQTQDAKQAQLYYSAIRDEINAIRNFVIEFNKTDQDIRDSLRRVAQLLASIEPKVAETPDHSILLVLKQRATQHQSRPLNLDRLQQILRDSLNIEEKLTVMRDNILLGEALRAQYEHIYAVAAVEWGELLQHASTTMNIVNQSIKQAESASPSEKHQYYRVATDRLRLALEELDRYRRVNAERRR